MITTALGAVIGTTRDRVWAALTDPAQVLRWDEPVLALLDRPQDYPRAGQCVRWRYRMGHIPIVCRESLAEVAPGTRLRATIDLGLFHFEQIWTLRDDRGPGQTRVGLRLAARSSIPVVGGLVDRFSVRRLANGYVDAKLRSLRGWCESRQPAECAPPGAGVAGPRVARG